MPRKPRFVIPGEPQHVITRGVNREPIFYTEQDYRYYLGRLKEALAKHDCALHAFVLMTNHVHLLLSPSSECGIGKVMQTLGRYYVQYFNYAYNRSGTLWEGRYKSALIDSENYLLICYRYIELNPVRAHMIKKPEEYPWSSYRFNALGYANPLLKPHDKYLELGRCEKTRQAGYRALFKGQIQDKQLTEIRSATNKEWVLGSDSFKKKISRKLDRQVTPKSRGGDRKSDKYRRKQKINRH